MSKAFYFAAVLFARLISHTTERPLRRKYGRSYPPRTGTKNWCRCFVQLSLNFTGGQAVQNLFSIFNSTSYLSQYRFETEQHI